MNRIYDISLELDILFPAADSRKSVLGSLVKKSFKLNISLNMQKNFHNIFFWITRTYLYLIMHFILKLQKSLYPASKKHRCHSHVSLT